MRIFSSTYSIRSLWLTLLLSLPLSATASSDDPATALQQRWDTVNFSMEGKQQLKAFKTLIDDANATTSAHPRTARAWLWSGIIKSSYAGVKGGLGALSVVKQSKSDFEKALELVEKGDLDTTDADAIRSSAYTSLGTLYANVPGWPIGFGDDEKAAVYLKKGIDLDPDGIVSNYFYGDYWRQQGDSEKARHYLEQALKAPDRPDRPIADAGRRKQIRAMLETLDN